MVSTPTLSCQVHLRLRGGGTSVKFPYHDDSHKDMALKDRIKAARQGAKLTQEQLANALGVSRPTVSQWENGDTKSLKAVNLVRMSQVTHVYCLWLATGEGTMDDAGERSHLSKEGRQVGHIWETLPEPIREEVWKLIKLLSLQCKSSCGPSQPIRVTTRRHK